MDIQRFLRFFDNAVKTSAGWMVRCPAHEDRQRSLAIAQGEHVPIVVHCFAGCSTDEICAALGIKTRDLFLPGENTTQAINRAASRGEEERFIRDLWVVLMCACERKDYPETKNGDLWEEERIAAKAVIRQLDQLLKGQHPPNQRRVRLQHHNHRG